MIEMSIEVSNLELVMRTKLATILSLVIMAWGCTSPPMVGGGQQLSPAHMELMEAHLQTILDLAEADYDDEASLAVERPEFRAQLMAMHQADQEARRTLNPADVEGIYATENVHFIVVLSGAHAMILLKMISELGEWPGFDIVGEDGAEAAWMVAQNTSRDREVQQAFLELLIKAVAQGQAEPRHMAFLADRMQMRYGEPQFFGTQISDFRDGKAIPYQIVDAENVDARRREVGLAPMAEFLQSIEAPQQLR